MASNHNQLFLKLIKEIEKGDITGETIKSISRENLWKELLDFMKEEGGSDNLGHYPIFQSDFKADTLFKYINATADMDSNEAPAGTYDFKKILDNLKSIVNPDGTANTGSGNNPWNESLTNSLTYFLRYIDPEYVADYEKSHGLAYTTDKDKETGRPLDVVNTNGSIPVKDAELKGGFRIDDVKNANAGNSFSKTSVRPWVRPNYNVDGETYDKVRGIDKILKVLASHKEMQFTRTQNQTEAESVVNKYIRLLMPKYLRRVEVEDLNRNFWVIGQVIAAISAYLFDEDSPIVKTFKNILNELIQLWENVLYLWATAMLLSQKPYYTKVHTEVVYVPNDSYRDYSKFDNFQNTKLTTLADIWTKRLSYLKDSYPECHLCILPVVRDNNYRHNYYGKETWPGVILYNRNLDTMEYRSFTSNNVFTINDELAKRMYCIHEDEDTFRYYAPYANVKTSDTESKLTEELSYRYTAALRVRPTAVAIIFNADDNNFTYTGVTLALDDAIGTAVTGSVKNVAQVSFGPSLAGTITYKQTPYTGTPVNSSVSKESVEKKIEELKQGYYLGELISDGNVSEEFTYDIQAQNIVLRPIIDSVGDIDSAGWDSIKADDMKILESLTSSVDSRQITLITGRHYASLLKKYNDAEGFQDMGRSNDMYSYSNGTVVKISKGTYCQTNDLAHSGAYKANGALTNIGYTGPQPGDQHYYDILGAAPGCTDPNSDDFKHGQIYQAHKDESLGNIKNYKDIYLKRCRFTSYQETAGRGAILKIGEQINKYSNYETFSNNLPRWSEIQLTSSKNQPPDMCDTLARLANITKDANKKYKAAVGRMGAETTTNKFFYKTSDGRMKKDNWVIEQIKTYFTFGPTMGMGTREDNKPLLGGWAGGYKKDYKIRNEKWVSEDYLLQQPYVIGYKNPTEWHGETINGTKNDWYNYFTAYYDKTNKKIALKYENNDKLTKSQYQSIYAPYGMYGWPLTSADAEALASMPKGSTKTFSPYWKIDAENDKQNIGDSYNISVEMSDDLFDILNLSDNTFKNRIYIEKSGLQLYPGWTVKVIISYFFPNNTMQKYVAYRLSDTYHYPKYKGNNTTLEDIQTWNIRTGSQYLNSPRVLENEGYTFFKATGDFTVSKETNQTDAVILDFSKNHSTGIYRP